MDHLEPINASGHIEAVEITRMLTRRSKGTGTELSFAGRPVSRQSRAQRVRVAFLAEGQKVPPPMFDPSTGRIDLFYSMSEYAEVRTLLTSRNDRLCYFWRSADGSNKLAWLLTAGS